MKVARVVAAAVLLLSGGAAAQDGGKVISNTTISLTISLGTATPGGGLCRPTPMARSAWPLTSASQVPASTSVRSFRRVPNPIMDSHLGPTDKVHSVEMPLARAG